MAKKVLKKAKLVKAQVGIQVTDSKKYLKESRKKTQAVRDSARASELSQGIKTYNDYLKKQITKKK